MAFKLNFLSLFHVYFQRSDIICKIYLKYSKYVVTIPINTSLIKIEFRKKIEIWLLNVYRSIHQPISGHHVNIHDDTWGFPTR